MHGSTCRLTKIVGYTQQKQDSICDSVQVHVRQHKNWGYTAENSGTHCTYSVCTVCIGACTCTCIHRCQYKNTTQTRVMYNLITTWTDPIMMPINVFVNATVGKRYEYAGLQKPVKLTVPVPPRRLLHAARPRCNLQNSKCLKDKKLWHISFYTLSEGALQLLRAHVTSYVLYCVVLYWVEYSDMQPLDLYITCTPYISSLEQVQFICPQAKEHGTDIGWVYNASLGGCSQGIHIKQDFTKQYLFPRIILTTIFGFLCDGSYVFCFLMDSIVCSSDMPR